MIPEDLRSRFDGHVSFEDSEHRHYTNPAVLDLHMFYDMRRVQTRNPRSA
jgi:hypothetical protein